MPKKLRPSGGYRKTASFQTATIIYDATYWFCEKFIDQRSRTVDQMVQAARSGRQNIAEGSRASATSSHTELRLLNVARASFEELLLDFEDFLRHRRLASGRRVQPKLPLFGRFLKGLKGIRRIVFPLVPNAAALWCYERLKAAGIQESSSGAAQITLIVQGC